MIQVLPLKDEKLKKELFEKCGKNIQNGECVTAADGDEILGYCLFSIVDNTVTIHEIMPRDDVLMADGVLRSALYVASQRFVFKAYCDNDNLIDLLKRLSFIKDEKTRELDMDKLFKSCNHSE